MHLATVSERIIHAKTQGRRAGRKKLMLRVPGSSWSVHLPVHKTSPSTSQVSGLRDCVTCDVAHPLLSETTHFNLASLHVYFRVGTTIIVPTWNLGSCSTIIPDSSFTKISICLKSDCLPCFVHLSKSDCLPCSVHLSKSDCLPCSAEVMSPHLFHLDSWPP